MGPSRSEASDSSKEETPLISGLPDDIALLCLIRVPRTYHANLKCVSKRWRNLVSGEEWRIIRKKYNLEETWIYALCEDGYGKGGIPKFCCYVLDPSAPRRCWKRIRDLPPCIVQRQCMHFEVLGQKAYLIGGRDFTESEWSADSYDDTLNIADEVHCYDATRNSWSKAAPMSTPRYLFSSEVLNGKIYSIGSNLNPDGRQTWESYDPVSNIWTAQSDPHVIGYSAQSIAYNGKLYVQNAFGAVYDPSTGIWQDADKYLVSGWHGTSVVVNERLYAIDLIVDFKLTMREEDRKKWTYVADLSPYLVQPGKRNCYCLVGTRKSIFFIGKGLVTIELDVRELFVSNVTRPVSEIRPIMCKCMTI